MLTTSVSSSPAWASLSHLTASSYCRFSIRHWNHAGHVRLVKLARFILAHTFTCRVPHTHLTPPPPTPPFHIHVHDIYMTDTTMPPPPFLPPPYIHAYALMIHTTHTWHSMPHICMHAFYTCHHHHHHPHPLSTHTHTHTKKNGIT